MSEDLPAYSVRKPAGAVYGYLRVSRDKQDVDNQKLGLLDYAHRHQFYPVELVEEVVARDQGWRQRELGRLLARVKPGDVILTAEFTRLGSRPVEVLSFCEEAMKCGATVHITKSNIVMDGSMQSQLMATVFAIASQIELSFIRARTKEGLQRAVLAGKKLGRPKGEGGKLKLDDRLDEVRGYLAINLPKRRMAQVLGVAYNTLDRFIERKGLDKQEA